MAKMPTKKPEKREPTDQEAKAIERAKSWWADRGPDRTPPKIEATNNGQVTSLASPHNDPAGWSAMWAESLGANSPVLLEAYMRNAGDIRGISTDNPAAYAQAAREAGAFVAAVNPQNEVESALGLQMHAAHEMTMKLSRHAFQTNDRNALTDYNRMMNQTMRTFTAQAEALHKLRTGGKQVHEVRYVYVDARTQTVINEGGGPPLPDLFKEQPHAPGTLGAPVAAGLPVWGNDTTGDRVPGSCDQGQATLPDARGQKSGRTKGRAQRKLHLRTMDGGDNPSARDGAGNGEAVSADAA